MRKRTGDTWKCLAVPCSSQAVRLGVSQPGLELHPCWIILCATLAKSFVSFESLSLALHAKLPGGIRQKGVPSQWCITAVYSRAWLWALLSISISEAFTPRAVTECSSKLLGRKRDVLPKYFIVPPCIIKYLSQWYCHMSWHKEWHPPSQAFTVSIFHIAVFNTKMLFLYL